MPVHRYPAAFAVSPLSDPEHWPLRCTAMCAIVSSTTFVQAWSYRPLTIKGGWSLRTRADKRPEGGSRAPHAVPALRGQELHDGGLGGPRSLLILRQAAG